MNYGRIAPVSTSRGSPEIDSGAPCYPAFALAVRLRTSYKDGVKLAARSPPMAISNRNALPNQTVIHSDHGGACGASLRLV
jgi:hypothetical protein